MIRISEAAVSRIQNMLEQESSSTSPLFIRFGVQDGGCTGMTYGLGFDDTQQEGDTTITIDGVKLVVNPESYPYVDGVEIDYKDTGMMGGFTIQNPNAIATCGCGNSFRTALSRGKREKCE
ncbi:HesB/IscA family protein [Brevibacillus sp. 179-C9.3 HS]|uniref:HesB/IscA family protein n=1 Tax=unclassified Brevibacillus TaxID=2684853 RepID=UPI00399FC4F5